ncbi:MAG TPA: tetratricopeptide repeat protein [Burkholderiales bacterium]|jgi:Flp pilus assembly protein TadD|nr:tetratricopeptide repeat protein [Burkholderiales bacterium]
MRYLKGRVLIGLAAIWVILSAPAAVANLGVDDEDSAADDPTVQEAQKALQAQDWAKAITLLEKAAAAHPESADVQNFLGYAHRKSGNLDAAFKHYQAALKLNPQHKPAHEYIGEAYLMKDDLAGAERHLAELQKLCTPIPCEELRELKRAIEEHKKGKK